MDHEQNQGTPLTSLMNWDQDGELHSEDLERLLARLQAQEVSQQNHDQTSGSKRKRVATTRAHNADPETGGCEQEFQLATRSRTT
jgi:ABC-type lipopolysaccharide export system ATPase subunit